MAFTDVASMILPAVGTGAGFAIGGPAGAMVGGAAGTAGSAAIRAATAEPPQVTGVTGAQQNILQQQQYLAERMRMESGLDPSQIANLDYGTMQKNLRLLNVLDSRSALYNLDPAAQQQLVDSFTESQQMETDRTRRTILEADFQKEFEEKRAEAAMLEAAGRSADRIRAARREREIALQRFDQAVANSLSSSIQSAIGAATKGAIYSEAMPEEGEPTEETEPTEIDESVIDDTAVNRGPEPPSAEDVISGKSLANIWG